MTTRTCAYNRSSISLFSSIFIEKIKKANNTKKSFIERVQPTNDVTLEPNRYCTFCRCDMSDTEGDINKYFALFRHYRLNSRLTQFIRLRTKSCGICPCCFRSYKTYYARSDTTSSQVIKYTNRRNLTEIQLEIISYYVFKVVVYLPIRFILWILSCIEAFYDFIKKKNDTLDFARQSMYYTNCYSNIQNGVHYRKRVLQAINKQKKQKLEFDTMTKTISESIAATITKTISELDRSLASLPKNDAPTIHKRFTT